MLARMIAYLTAGTGFRANRWTGATPVHEGPDGVADIADRLARIHDYLLGAVESLDADGSTAESPAPQKTLMPHAAAPSKAA